MRNNLRIFSLAVLLGACGDAHADVTCEHVGKVTIGDDTPQTMFTMDIKSTWSGQRNRIDFSYDGSGAAGMMGLKPGAVAKTASTNPVELGVPADPAKGSFTAIYRLDDDRVINIMPATKQYLDEPLSTMAQRVRLNFWKDFGLDDNLTNTEIPQLTDEQRQRLGAELRAVVAPVIKKSVFIFFRPVAEKKMVDGQMCIGFRLTAKINCGAGSPTPQWANFGAEWWIADSAAGDAEIRAFQQALMAIKQKSGGPTASMWINEMPQVLYDALPREVHDAFTSFVGTPDSANYGYQGLPVAIYVTITPPAAQAMLVGSIRMTLDLKSYSTDAVAPITFDPPTGYTKVPLEPMLQMAENAMKQEAATIQKMMPQ